MPLDAITPHIESLIFAADRPVSLDEIQECLESTFEALIPPDQIQEAIRNLFSRYQQEDFAFGLVEIAGGWQFMTKPAYHSAVHTYLRQSSRKRLSVAALETLAIIAYKQPVTKSELESIRGVSCDYSIQKLLEKELIAITGRSETVGKPLLYGTSEKFMDYFGLKSLADLPKLRDFKAPDEEIGESPSIDEVVDSLRAGQKAVAEVIDPGLVAQEQYSEADRFEPVLNEEE
jgi:segregation and condensation protein B